MSCRARAKPVSIMPRCDGGLLARTSNALRAAERAAAGAFHVCPIKSSQSLVLDFRQLQMELRQYK